MAAREDLTDIDQNIAANVRIYREAADISQEDLAQRMTGRGFSFSQATVWKIENGQRPIKASELIALADSLGGLRLAPMSLTREPGIAQHRAQMQRANHLAHAAYGALKEAAAAYIEAQIEVVVAARQAHDAGVTVTELDTSWLSVPAEEAVIEARVECDQAEDQRQQVHDEVGKVLEALRTAGYKPVLRIEDVELSGGGPLPVWTPAQSADT